VLAGGFPLSFPYYFQVRSAACVLVFLLIFPEAFQAPAGAHVALCDVAVPAGLAGEVALQVERFGFITADDVAGIRQLVIPFVTGRVQFGVSTTVCHGIHRLHRLEGAAKQHHGGDCNADGWPAGSTSSWIMQRRLASAGARIGSHDTPVKDGNLRYASDARAMLVPRRSP
jgi:hypothetical protein